MAKPEVFKEQAEALEHRATMVARHLAAELHSPTPARKPLAEGIEQFDRLRAETADVIVHLRRSLGREARQTQKYTVKPPLTPAQYLRVMRRRLMIWGSLVGAASDCAAGYDWPLLPVPRPRWDLRAAEDRIMSNVFTEAHRSLNQSGQAADATALGCYADIPLNVSRFARAAHLAYRILRARKHDQASRFLDVGCGGGMKVALAASFFDSAHGLDYDPGYVEVARRNFRAMPAPRCDAFQADGITYDGYGDYDVIYFFQPMAIEAGLDAIEDQIAGGARPGAILIAPYDCFIGRAAELGCSRVAEDVYVKGIEGEELATLIAETRMMGPHVPSPDRLIPSEAGWLEPLWLACEANGIIPG